MHARLDQLLSLRDGEPIDASVRDHVVKCTDCATQLTRLATTREHLLSLPMLDPPSEPWTRISERISHVAPQRLLTARHVWIGASAAAVVLSIITVALLKPPGDSKLPSQSYDHAGAELSALVERSQQLEVALGALPQRPTVERVATAANIDGIEQRIEWLDFHLTAANDSLDQAQTQQLWQERVNLMDSLVKLRYAEARIAQL
jgi:hypothetical protein